MITVQLLRLIQSSLLEWKYRAWWMNKKIPIIQSLFKEAKS